MNIPVVFWLVPIASLVALVMAYYFFAQMMKADEGIIGKGVKFERVRRITGYLTGDVSRWNDAKFAELKDRVKHLGFGKVRGNHRRQRKQIRL